MLYYVTMMDTECGVIDVVEVDADSFMDVLKKLEYAIHASAVTQLIINDENNDPR